LTEVDFYLPDVHSSSKRADFVRSFPLSNLFSFILGASLALVFLAGCGNSGSTSTSGGSNVKSVGCGTNTAASANSAAPSTIDVGTYHYDNSRTGQNTKETILTPANVNSTQFGKLGEFSVIGKVDAQPLYLSNVSISGVMKNVLYVATEHGCLFAFDADSIAGTTAKALWITSTSQSGEVPSDDRGCGQVTPEIGITSTPAIDRSRGAIYVVSVSKDGSGNYRHRLHALDLTTGAELFGGPTTITANFPGTGAGSSGGNVVFDPSEYSERPGLLQVGNTIYTTWGSHCDVGQYTSWVMTFNADTLKQTSVLNLTPNGNDGGIWMAGTAPAADAAGNIYFLIGNGTFDTTLNSSGFPSAGDCGNCFVKLAPSLPLALADYFTPSNTVMLSNSDLDLGSGGPLLLPDLTDGSGATRHLAVASGKSNPAIYIVDRDNMGKFNSNADTIYQEFDALPSAGEFAKPSYFNNTVYYGAVGDNLKAFPISNARLATAPSSRTSATFAYPGTTPSISANGTANGIVWAVENSGASAILHAYDAANLARELYNSNQAANGRDQFADNKFVTPMVVNGRVYVGTPASVAVFGLLP
jgi:hypothetical protein